MGGVGGVTILASLLLAGGGVIGGDWRCQHITQVGGAVAAGNLAMWKVSSRGGAVAWELQRPHLRPHLGPYGQLYKKQPAKSVA